MENVKQVSKTTSCVASFHIIVLATYKTKKGSTAVLSEKNGSEHSCLNKRF